MATLILFNKPFQVLSQFTSEPAPDGKPPKPTLADWITLPSVYPAGRLDYDSEGLLLLTDNGALQHHIASPKQKMPKTYWVQVEGVIDDDALELLRNGVELKDGITRPALAERMHEPDIWPRNPPVRYRARIPTSWLQLTIREGKNRQVRRMTAAVGFPTLRLIRYAVGDWTLDQLAPGQYRQLVVHSPTQPKRRSRQKPARRPAPANKKRSAS